MTARAVVWATRASTPLAFCLRQGFGRREGARVETRWEITEEVTLQITTQITLLQMTTQRRR